MLKEIKELQKAAFSELDKAQIIEDIEKVRIKYLGRKSKLNQILKGLKNLTAEQKAEIGKVANVLKKKISQEIEIKIISFSENSLKPKIDITIPGIKNTCGHIHPITKTIYEICDVFTSLGFNVVEGPEAEKERYNFEVLNIPLDHPARDAFDTFYLKEDLLLRSHTSPVQVRVMEKEKPPIAIIVPGRVYRPDAVDATHSFMFHQVEGLLVDRDITFSDLKGTLSVFLRKMFGKDVKVRFRPHFFPFTEPSADLDVSCFVCNQKGCRVCSYTGWLEIGGAGMVDPEVFKAVHYDYNEFSGFAFGMGVERIAMLKYGINDIRLFFENDYRFLKQF